MNFDLLIKNGWIIDGTGRSGYSGDLAVHQGKILEINSKLEYSAARVIDASGMIVSPGFIDPHVHGELAVLTSGNFEDFLRQGVTTTVNGNCGHSITPYSSYNILDYMTRTGLISGKEKMRLETLNPPWRDFSGYINIVKTRGTNINMGFLLGHGSLRWSIMGAKTGTPNLSAEKELARLIEEGMEQGALGLSTGLAYTPGRYAGTDELIRLAAIIRNYDGIYTTHLRTYLGLLAAVREAIRIGESSGTSVQISHLSPTCPEAFAEVLAARDRGFEIGVDTIPKTSGHFKRRDRFLQFFLSGSALSQTSASNVSSQDSPNYKITKALLRKIRFKDQLMVYHTLDPQMENRTLKDISEERGMTVDHLLLQLLKENNPNLTFCQGGVNRWDFPGIPYPDDIAHNPLVMVGSDRIFGDSQDPYDWYELFRKGAFPIYFDLCKNKGVAMEEIIRRVTSWPAQQFRLRGRGILAQGYAADLTIFAPENFTFPSNSEIDVLNPLTMASGVHFTIVNGSVALDHGIVQEINAGQVLLRNGKIL